MPGGAGASSSSAASKAVGPGGVHKSNQKTDKVAPPKPKKQKSKDSQEDGTRRDPGKETGGYCPDRPRFLNLKSLPRVPKVGPKNLKTMLRRAMSKVVGRLGEEDDEHDGGEAPR